MCKRTLFWECRCFFTSHCAVSPWGSTAVFRSWCTDLQQLKPQNVHSITEVSAPSLIQGRHISVNASSDLDLDFEPVHIANSMAHRVVVPEPMQVEPVLCC